MTFLVADAALYGGAGVEHVTYPLAEGLGAVKHAEHALTDIQAAIDEIGQQRGRDRRVLRRALPQPQRDLHALRRDPQGDDVAAALQIDSVEHQHGQANVV
jgi:hypothetical protein